MFFRHIMINADEVFGFYFFDKNFMILVSFFWDRGRQLHAVAMYDSFAHGMDHIAAYRADVKF